MRQKKTDEPLIAPWMVTMGLILAPIAVTAGIYYVMSQVLHVPGKVALPVVIVLVLGILIYFGGGLHKPFHVDKAGRCVAKGRQARAKCRHYIPGARLGGGCGRLREDGRCRYVR